MVDGYTGCGCATVGLSVKPDTPRAQTTLSTVPNSASIFDAEGKETGGIIICLVDGYLALLEIFDYYREPHGISPFPPIDQLEISGP
jgi:hypothetical protein